MKYHSKLVIYLRIDYAGDFVDFYKSFFFSILLRNLLKKGVFDNGH